MKNFKKYKYIFYLFVLCSSVLVFSENYILVNAYGRLGNALFQTATALPFAMEHDYTILIDDSYKTEYPVTFRKFRSVKEVKESELKPTSITLHFKSIETIKPLIEQRKNVRLEVGSFVFKDFEHHKDLIIEKFSPNTEMLERLQNRHSFLDKSKTVVGIHLRVFYDDVVYELNRGQSLASICQNLPFPDVNFLQQAIELLPQDALFIVCSDYLPWAKFICNALPRRDYLFIDGNSPEEDLYLLSLCDHLVLSPYSFSWWAAYLNRNPDKIVIAPAQDHLSYPEEYVILPYASPKVFPFKVDYTETI